MSMNFFLCCFSILGAWGLSSQFHYSVVHFHTQPHQSQWHVARVALIPGSSEFPWLYMVESQHQRAQARNREVTVGRGKGRVKKDKMWNENEMEIQSEDEERGVFIEKETSSLGKSWQNIKNSIVIVADFYTHHRDTHVPTHPQINKTATPDCQPCRHLPLCLWECDACPQCESTRRLNHYKTHFRGEMK